MTDPTTAHEATSHNVEKRRDGSLVYFDFKCPGCEVEGEIGIDSGEGMTPFDCPEACGAVFVPWQPDGAKWILKCVVQPFIEENAHA